MSYRLEITEEQAKVLSTACEVLARLGIGQFRDAPATTVNGEVRMKPLCWRRSGALMVSCPIPGVTQDLDKSLTFNHAADSMRFYEGRYFVCESITIEAAKAIAKAMGWQWSDKPIPTHTATSIKPCMKS